VGVIKKLELEHKPVESRLAQEANGGGRESNRECFPMKRVGDRNQPTEGERREGDTKKDWGIKGEKGVKKDYRLPYPTTKDTWQQIQL